MDDDEKKLLKDLRLPRLHRRGPIEAQLIGFGEFMLVYVFHGFIAVAPLKREQEWKFNRSSGSLPRLHRRGPIEATTNPAVAAGLRQSSTASSPWPH